MPYKIEWNNTGTILRFSGTVSIQEIHSANGELHSDPRTEDQYYTIWDLSKTDFSSITTRMIVEPAATDTAAMLYISHMKVAFVAKEAHKLELIHSYIDYCLKLHSPWEFATFDNVELALIWAQAPKELNI